jgi:hypothetical protein
MGLENQEGQVHDDENCLRCILQKQAASLEIECHEWPLAADKLKAKALIFELEIPAAIAA